MEKGAIKVSRLYAQIWPEVVSKSTWIFSKMRKQNNTNFHDSKSSKNIKIGPMTMENGAIKVSGLYAQIWPGVVSKSTWIFSKMRKPKNTNFRDSKSSKIIKINRIVSENGPIKDHYIF